MAERYEPESSDITSNVVFSEWERISENPIDTAAAVGWAIQRSVIQEFDPPSYRTGVAQQFGQDQEVNRQ